MEVWCLRHPGAFTIGSLAASRRRLLPWLANPGNAGLHEPPREREESRHPPQWARQWKEGGKGVGNHHNLSLHNCEIHVPGLDKCSLIHNCPKTPKCQNAKVSASEHATMHTTPRAHGILVHAHLAIRIASKIRLTLLVINSDKLHLTACKKNKTNNLYQFIVVPSPDDSPSPTSSSLKKSDVPIRWGNGRFP